MNLIGNLKIKEKLIGNIHLLKKVHGYSAYDLAVKYGYKGTEEEWVQSLKGPKGDPGTLENHTEIDALGHRVVNVAEPEEDTDGASKGYVDVGIEKIQKFIEENLVTKEEAETHSKHAEDTFMTRAHRVTFKNYPTGESALVGAFMCSPEDNADVLSVAATDADTGDSYMCSYYKAKFKLLGIEKDIWWVKLYYFDSFTPVTNKKINLEVCYVKNCITDGDIDYEEIEQ